VYRQAGKFWASVVLLLTWEGRGYRRTLILLLPPEFAAWAALRSSGQTASLLSWIYE
jgi:hypothetical protein